MRRILGAILGLTAVTNAISIKQIVEAEAEPVDTMAEAETIAEAVPEAVACEQDKRGHDGCCGGNKVNVDISFNVNLGGQPVDNEE